MILSLLFLKGFEVKRKYRISSGSAYLKRLYQRTGGNFSLAARRSCRVTKFCQVVR